MSFELNFGKGGLKLDVKFLVALFVLSVVIYLIATGIVNPKDIYDYTLKQIDKVKWK